MESKAKEELEYQSRKGQRAANLLFLRRHLPPDNATPNAKIERRSPLRKAFFRSQQTERVPRAPTAAESESRRSEIALVLQSMQEQMSSYTGADKQLTTRGVAARHPTTEKARIELVNVLCRCGYRVEGIKYFGYESTRDPFVCL
ncbi:hypothetical protein JTB14_034678 [Gonioctena quinquepunctata]|nr:hypothetical protein JTB14_034678 [Gonioctena quinquepunctata]